MGTTKARRRRSVAAPSRPGASANAAAVLESDQSAAAPDAQDGAMRISALLPWYAALCMLSPGCAVEVANTQATRELTRGSSPPGSVYAGWRLFQDRCARCHGESGTGAGGPDLLPRVRALGPRRFVDLVLHRYEWGIPAPDAASQSAALDALVDSILRREAGALTMPVWEGEPRVQAHIADLYAYLSARADGRAGPDRPPR